MVTFRDKDGYVIRTINNKKWREHRWVWTQHHGEIPKGLQVDHINGKLDDNRIENLQLLTNKQNSQRNKFGNIRKTRCGRLYEARRSLNGKEYRSTHGTLGGAYMANRVVFL